MIEIKYTLFLLYCGGFLRLQLSSERTLMSQFFTLSYSELARLFVLFVADISIFFIASVIILVSCSMRRSAYSLTFLCRALYDRCLPFNVAETVFEFAVPHFSSAVREAMLQLRNIGLLSQQKVNNLWCVACYHGS